LSAKIRTQKWLELLGISVRLPSVLCYATDLALKEEKLRRVKFIHVAGTKGKGTTCLFAESILSEYRKANNCSIKIGCLTSPHLTNIRERIRVDSSPISEKLFAAHFSEIWSVMQKYPRLACASTAPSLPGYPGFLSLLALHIFAKEDVDIAIIETGIGGENDSTNVIPCPSATGITTIGLDHVNVLGNTLSSIAWHKAGIFKQGAPAFTVEQEEEVMNVLHERAIERRICGPLRVVPQLAKEFGVRVEPDMAYQQKNASLAIALTEAYLKTLDPSFTMTSHLASAIERTKLPGRNQTVRQGNMVWFVSPAHNEISVNVASTWFRDAVTHSRYAPVDSI
jgi:folylpolyglutamate synthase